MLKKFLIKIKHYSIIKLKFSLDFGTVVFTFWISLDLLDLISLCNEKSVTNNNKLFYRDEQN